MSVQREEIIRKQRDELSKITQQAQSATEQQEAGAGSFTGAAPKSDTIDTSQESKPASAASSPESENMATTASTGTLFEAATSDQVDGSQEAKPASQVESALSPQSEDAAIAASTTATVAEAVTSDKNSDVEGNVHGNNVQKGVEHVHDETLSTPVASADKGENSDAVSSGEACQQEKVPTSPRSPGRGDASSNNSNAGSSSSSESSESEASMDSETLLNEGWGPDTPGDPDNNVDGASDHYEEAPGAAPVDGGDQPTSSAGEDKQGKRAP